MRSIRRWSILVRRRNFGHLPFGPSRAAVVSRRSRAERSSPRPYWPSWSVRAHTPPLLRLPVIRFPPGACALSASSLTAAMGAEPRSGDRDSHRAQRGDDGTRWRSVSPAACACVGHAYRAEHRPHERRRRLRGGGERRLGRRRGARWRRVCHAAESPPVSRDRAVALAHDGPLQNTSAKSVTRSARR